MAFYMYHQSNKKDYQYKEFVVDTASEVANLPTTSVSPGSVCFIVEGSRVFMLNAQFEWKEI